MVYERMTNTGEVVKVKQPVIYKVYDYNSNEDNDRNYEYRNYRIEMERMKKAKEAKKEIDHEEESINSAANYPLYFD